MFFKVGQYPLATRIDGSRLGGAIYITLGNKHSISWFNMKKIKVMIYDILICMY